MGPRLAHLNEQVEYRYRRRNKQQLAQKRSQFWLAALCHRAEHILDVNEADDVVERLPINRDPGMTLNDHAFGDIGKLRFEIERDDVDARDHHICGRLVMDFEYIAYQQ